jgi:hypothetical protein
MDDHYSRHFPVREDMTFQRCTWVAQRFGWACIAMIPVLGLSGVFANGILSDQVLERPSLRLEYERFQRVTVLTRIVAHLSPAAGDEAHLRLNKAFQANYEIDSMVPRPSQTAATADGLDLTFERSESAPVTVVIWARPQSFGLVKLTAEGERGRVLDFSVLVYP